MREFLKKNIKIIIFIIFIIILVLAIIVANIKKKNNLSEYIKINYNYFIMYSNDEKVGVVDKTGKSVLEPIYSDILIPNPSKDVFICYKTGTEYDILNNKGEKLFSDYEDVQVLQTSELVLDFEKAFLSFKKNGKYGLIDYSGKVIVSADYDNVESLKYRSGEILVTKEGKCGVIGTDGNIKIPLKYDSIVGDEFYTEKYAYGETGYIVGEKTETGYLYGYLNNYGEEVLKSNYESISRVLKYNDSNAYLIVMNNGKKGVYKNSKEIIGQNYQGINYADSSNIFIARRNSNYGIFSIEGKEILPVKYTAYSVAGDYISVQINDNEKELYDVNGNKVSNLNYNSIQAAGDSNCYIAIDNEGYHHIITQSETISDNYTYITYAFDNNFIFKNENGNYGVLNIYSGIIIEPEYNFMLVVDGKKAIEAERADGSVDIYSKDIEKISTMNGAIVENITENYAKIYSNSEIIYINKNGKIVENTEVFPDNKIYAYNANGKWGFIDKSNNTIIEAKYDFVTELNEYGFAGILLDGKWGVVNSNGEIIVEPSYIIDTYYLPTFVGKYLLETNEIYHCIIPNT